MFCANNLGHERKDTTSSSQQFRVLIINSIFFLLLQLCKAPTAKVCGVWRGWPGGGGGRGVGFKGLHECNKDSHIEEATGGHSHKQHLEKTGHKDKINNRAKAMFALN